MHDLIIVGGGPAGLTATVYAINKHLDTLLLCEDLGGKANYRMRLRGMEGFEHITGEEIVRKFKGQVEYLDYACRSDRAVRLETLASARGRPVFRVTTAGGAVLEGRSVIVATGAVPRSLGCPGEREFLGRGVSYSAVSHAPLLWGRDAAVVGSGRLALRAAAELATLANQVYLIAPEALAVDAPLGELLGGLGNVRVMHGFTLESVGGGEFVTEATVRDPAGEVTVIPLQGVFVEIGHLPASEIVDGLCALDDEGHVVVDSRGATTHPGIFAAGDVTSTYAGQVLIAVGDGAKATLAAFEYLLEQGHGESSPSLST